MKITPKDFFLQLAVIILLYVVVGSLLTLLFQVINIAFPDVLESRYYYGSYDPYSGGIRFAIASLVVIFPLYLVLTKLIRRDQDKFPEKRESALRKWLTYLTLFIAGGILVGDLIAVINTFLSGELTTRFLLKALSVLVVIGLVFGYYGYDLVKKTAAKTAVTWVFEIASVLIVLSSLIVGFVVMGSPQSQRDLRLDEMRTSDLQQIQWNVIDYWQQKRELPQTLDLVADATRGVEIPTDPATKEAYEYRVTGNLSFELCATFEQESNQNESYPIVLDRGVLGSSWQHGEGRHCFERIIDPDFYPPQPEPLI